MADVALARRKELLQQRGLDEIEAFKDNVVLCLDDSGRKVIYKEATQGELHVARAVDRLAKECNDGFKLLQLPVYDRIEVDEGYLVMPYYGTGNFRQAWMEDGSGGASMGVSLAKEMAWILIDLAGIDLDLAREYISRDILEEISFDSVKAQEQIFRDLKIVYKKNYISIYEYSKAKRIFRDACAGSVLVLNNGDYYPSNLIKVGHKYVLVDWDTWSVSYRTNIIDSIENVIAFTYIHMWNNPKWQAAFLAELRNSLPMTIDIDDLRKAVLSKSLLQFEFLSFHKLGEHQLRIFKNVLREFGWWKLQGGSAGVLAS
ncbi:MAG: hypothetical protein WAW37_03905 [Syntrophobacteraceae bacterium]